MGALKAIPSIGDPEVTVTRTLVHQCPVLEEVDTGTVVIDWAADGQTLELHALAAYLDGFADVRISHEELTSRIANDIGALGFFPWVTTTWITAGMAVTVKALPNGSLLRESDRLEAGA